MWYYKGIALVNQTRCLMKSIFNITMGYFYILCFCQLYVNNLVNLVNVGLADKCVIPAETAKTITAHHYSSVTVDTGINM